MSVTLEVLNAGSEVIPVFSNAALMFVTLEVSRRGTLCSDEQPKKISLRSTADEVSRVGNSRR